MTLTKHERAYEDAARSMHRVRPCSGMIVLCLPLWLSLLEERGNSFLSIG